MSNNKRPRPAVPVLVHVDNPSGGDSAEITEEVKSLSNAVGTLTDSAQRRTLMTMTSDMRKALDDSTEAVENIHSNIGTTTDFSTDTTVIGLLKNIKENMAGGGGGSGGGVDMTTVNTNTTQINNVLGNVSEESTSGTINGRLQRNNELTENNNDKLVNIKNAIGEAGDVVSASTISGRLHSVAYVTGTRTDSADDTTISGKLQAIKSTVGKVSDDPAGTTISARLAAIKNAATSNYTIAYNLRDNIGFPNAEPTDNTVIGLLKGIKANGGSGGGADMTTVNTNTTDIKNTIGTSGDPQDTNTISGKLSALRGTNNTIALYSETIRNNLGVSSDSSSSNTVIGLLKRIIENN